jgi:hypothetical protein
MTLTESCWKPTKLLDLSIVWFFSARPPVVVVVVVAAAAERFSVLCWTPRSIVPSRILVSVVFFVLAVSCVFPTICCTKFVWQSV